jgi:nitrogen-specific signal transduction histidine kinase/TolB-like protein/DNA-binding NarL/FixJ family response regulator
LSSQVPTSEKNEIARVTAGSDLVAGDRQNADQASWVLNPAKAIDSLARLAGGVAHDFNNLLTVVIGHATALRLDAEARGDTKGARRAEIIERSAERGGRLAGQLLAFARNQVLRPESISAYGALSGMYESLALASGDTVRIRLLGDNDLWDCRVDPGQFDSAILSLVLNARDAMPAGGDIIISCHNETKDFAETPGSARSPGDYIRVDVKDFGTGIPPHLLAKVFEPFFTTKPIGKGSGLGLAQVHGFAGQSGGWAELHSQLGHGTTVSLYLPRAKDRQFDPLTQAEWPEACGSQLTVLVVEPDTDHQTMICESLIQSGYHAIAATNASGALAFLASNEPVHLLLTEAQLPGDVSGIALMRDARCVRPDIQALVTSSSTDNATHTAHGEVKSFEFLKKPYQLTDLVRLVGALSKSDTFCIRTEEIFAEAHDTGRPARPPPPSAPLSVSPRQLPSRGTRTNAIRLGIMPFRTTGSHNEHDLSLGLAEEFAGAFARFRWITCVAPASVAALAVEPLGPMSRWQQLDLDFLVEGTLRTKGDELRVLVRLLNMRGSGEMIWAQDFDSSMPDCLHLQDQIASATAAQIAPEVLVWQAEKEASRPRVHSTAYDLMLRAIPAIYRLDQASFRTAGSLLEKSLEMDRSNAACHSWLAHWLLLLVGQGWAPDPVDASRQADQLAQQAIVLDPGDARGITMAGHVQAFLHRDPERALGLHERAIALNPNLALAWCYSGLAHSYLGRHTEAIRHIQRARRLSPHDPHGFFFDTALVIPFLFTGNYEIAAQLGRRARNANHGLSSTYKVLLAALGKLGLTDESAQLRGELFALEPKFSVQEALMRAPFLQQDDRDRYAEGLRAAGIPETT